MLRIFYQSRPPRLRARRVTERDACAPGRRKTNRLAPIRASDAPFRSFRRHRASFLPRFFYTGNSAFTRWIPHARDGFGTRKDGSTPLTSTKTRRVEVRISSAFPSIRCLHIRTRIRLELFGALLGNDIPSERVPMRRRRRLHTKLSGVTVIFFPL
jgi:hypothetical protein